MLVVDHYSKEELTSV